MINSKNHESTKAESETKKKIKLVIPKIKLVIPRIKLVQKKQVTMPKETTQVRTITKQQKENMLKFTKSVNGCLKKGVIPCSKDIGKKAMQLFRAVLNKKQSGVKKQSETK